MAGEACSARRARAATTDRARLAAPLAAAGCAGAVLVAVRLRDPHVPGTWGLCPYLLLVGSPCPLCGGLRATADLLRLDVAAALASNPVVTLALPVTVVAWVLWMRARVRGTRVPARPLRAAGIALLAAAVLLGLLRLGGLAAPA